jgi:hypothetical protein
MSEFSFADPIKDLTECPAGCKYGPYGRDFCAHDHCPIDGCVLLAEGGGGNDGKSIGGYSTVKGGEVVACEDCKVRMALTCARPHGYHGAKYWCSECDRLATTKAQEYDAPVVNVQNALDDMRSSRKAYARCDSQQQAQIRTLLREIFTEVCDYRAETQRAAA